MNIGVRIGHALTAVAFSTLLFSASALAQTTMRINVSMPKDGHHGVAIDAFAAEVDRLTEGRYKIETFYAGSLGAERESIEAVQLGTLELTFTSTGPVPNFVPETEHPRRALSSSATTPTRAPCLDGPIGNDCWAGSRHTASRRWPGLTTASAT